MLRCPHCHELGIPVLAKLLSDPGAPAHCHLCGKLSYANAVISHINNIVALPLAVLAIAAAIHFRAWWPIVLLFLTFPALAALALALPATPTAHERAKRARWLFVLGGVIAVLAILSVGVFQK